MSNDVVARIDALIPADEVHSHPLVWRARNVDLALLIDARNEIRALRLENHALRQANAGMVGRAEHARVVGGLTREAERLRARVEVLELIRRYMGQGVSWDRAEERAIDEIEERKARAALEAKP